MCYIMQATLDTRPEDLLVTPVIEGEGRLRYVASPLVSAMITGGVAILDEGNRMSEKSWASLAPLLDNRRYVESIVAGVKIKAHPNFRLVTTMNDDASTFELPEYIHSRLQPQILIDFPEKDEEYPHSEGESALRRRPRSRIRHRISSQQAHAADERYSVRDGINIARYAIKLKSLATGREHERMALETAVLETLGEEALRYARRTPARLLPDFSGSRSAAASRYLPVVPGRLEFAARSAPRASSRDRPRRGRRRTARRLSKHVYLEAVAGCRRSPSSSITTRIAPTRIREPDGQRRLRPRRAGRPLRGSHPHRAAKSAPRSSSPIPIRPSGRICPTLIPTPTRCTSSRWAVRRSVPASIRSRARRKSSSSPQGIAWKLQGADPVRARARGALAESAGSGSRCDGGAAVGTRARGGAKSCNW